MTIIKPITLSMKQDFIVRALADRRFYRRGKVVVSDKGGDETATSRRVALSAFDGAVLACIVFHCNPKRGYSFVGGRRVAELMSRRPPDEGEGGWMTSPSGVAKSISKLKALGILLEVAGGKSNKARRLAPNWPAYLDLAVYSHDGDSGVHSYGGDEAVHSHEGSLSATSKRVDRKERKRTGKEAKGTLRASLACVPAPVRDGRRRSARPKNGNTSGASFVEKIMKRRRAGTKEDAGS